MDFPSSLPRMVSSGYFSNEKLFLCFHSITPFFYDFYFFKSDMYVLDNFNIFKNFMYMCTICSIVNEKSGYVLAKILAMDTT